MDINEKFQSAFRYHHNGNLQQAERLYKEILEVYADHVPALHLLGVVFYQLGNFDSAIEYIRKSLCLNQSNPDAYNHLGSALKAKGHLKEAITCHKKAIELNPAFVEAYYNLGNTMIADGQLDEAIACYQEVIRLNPKFIQAYCNLGEAFHDTGKYNDAIITYQAALKLKPDSPDIYLSLATVLQEKGDGDKAIMCCKKAVELDPDSAKTCGTLGKTLQKNGQLTEALIYYKKALELNPHRSDLYNLYNNLGILYQANGQFREALTSYLNAIQIDPQCADAHSNLSLLLLLSGSLQEGWREYEWRLLKKNARIPPYPQNIWDGKSLKGQKLIVSAEQGVGDSIMFASCLPEVVAQADLCIIECDKRLVTLFARSFPQAKAIKCINDHDTAPANLPTADLQIAIGSLPKFLRQDLLSFPKDGAYLKPDIQKVALWRDRYSSLGIGIKIGISWRGGSNPSAQLARSTTLGHWSKLFSLTGVHFINLQYGNCAYELTEAREKAGFKIYDWEDADPLKDLDSFAAQISPLDLVISVDNSTVHMAGALGVPVWTLLPYACDWRWMRKFEDTPWYKTLRVFRQSEPGKWNDVFDRVFSSLKLYVETGIMPGITFSYKSLIKQATT